MLQNGPDCPKKLINTLRYTGDYCRSEVSTEVEVVHDYKNVKIPLYLMETYS
jgi:hypothetical protein